MNYDLISEYWPEIWLGFQTTLLLSCLVIAISTPIAFLIAVIRHLRIPGLSPLLSGYVHLFRALPALVVLFFAFYALPKLGFALQPFPAAVVGMVATSVAYVSEDFRAGIAAIGKGQWDAGHALGLGVGRIVRRIILPQAIPIMVPSFMTNAIIIVKATAIASLIGVSELTGASMGAMSITYSALDFLMIAAVLYLIISAVLATLQAIIEFALERRLTARPRA
ncbi:MAG: amino acid ABC transporter permease [Methylobacterium sp.]|jgi:cystine transport system permease protein